MRLYEREDRTQAEWSLRVSSSYSSTINRPHTAVALGRSPSQAQLIAAGVIDRYRPVSLDYPFQPLQLPRLKATNGSLAPMSASSEQVLELVRRSDLRRHPSARLAPVFLPPPSFTSGRLARGQKVSKSTGSLVEVGSLGSSWRGWCTHAHCGGI
ncbi:hypothetical protein AB1Y20_019527 [Prymnesium parvum]|uniref:Uncharacterized protein n=1 Tax=Prymnesium parvum TaxID=97485 RepID=A0AB34JS22_PRYPA